MAAEQDLLDTSAAGPAAIRGGAMRLVAFGIGSLLSVLSVALMFRHLGLEDSGRYVTILALVAIAGGVTDAGLVGIGVREYAQTHGESRDVVMRRLLGLRIVLTCAGVVAAVVFALAAGYSSTMVLGTVLAGVAFLLIAIQSACSVGLQAQLRLGTVAGADLVRQVVNVVSVVLLVAVGASLLPFFVANIPAALAALAITAYYVRGSMPLRPTFDVRQWGELLRDTIPYAVATAVGAVYFRLAIILMSLIASAEETGYFGASFRGVEVLIVVPQLLVSSAFPIFSRAARDDHERLSYAMGRVFAVCLLLGVAVAVLLVVGAPFIIDVVAGPDFEPAEDVLRIHGIGLVASFAAAAWGYAALSLRQHRAILLVSLGALVVSAALVSVLASTNGAVGAAIGTAVAEGVLMLGLGLAVRRTGVSLGVDVGITARVLVAGALAVALGLLAIGAGGVPSVVAAALALLVYAAAVGVLGALPEELLAAVRSRRQV
jgi:O-antigen/teichoic acid export membrane protein